MDNWACPKCGFTNDSSAARCVSCEQPRVTEATPSAEPTGSSERASSSAAKQLEIFQAEARAMRASATKAGLTPVPAPLATPVTAAAAAPGDTRPGGCQLCGRQPAAPFSFRSNVGMVFARRTYKFDGWLCRACAKGKFREFQGRNLAWGWFGYISFFQTLGNGFHNLTDYRSNRQRLSEPTPPDPARDKKSAGLPVFVRVLPGLGVIAAIVAVIAVVLTVQAREADDRPYIDDFITVNAVRAEISELADSRNAAWVYTPEHPIPGPEYLILDELKSLLADVERMTPPASNELRALHADWLASLHKFVEAEQLLVAQPTQASLAADNQASQQEYAAYGAVFDYCDAHQ